MLIKKIEEKKRLEDEIQKAAATLEEKNVEIQTVNEYKALKDELKKYGLSTEKYRTLVSVLRTVNQLGFDPRKIVRELARLKSLRQTERRLKDNCKSLESRAPSTRKLSLCANKWFQEELDFLYC